MPIIDLRLPVLVMVLAATAIPVALRPPQSFEWLPVSLDGFDVMANIAGFVPVGLALAELGLVPAIAIAAFLSLLAELGQTVMLYRTPSLMDVTTNVIGAALGVIVALRYNIRLEVTATRRLGIIAAALAALLILGAWIVLGDASRTGATPGTGGLEGHWLLDGSSGRVALDATGHGLNGEYRNQPKPMTAPAGGATIFDGTTDYVDLGHPAELRLSSSMTLSAWIKSTSYPRDDAVIISSASGVGFQLDTTIDTGPRTIGFKLTNSCGLMMARYGKTPLALDRWYHAAGVYDAKAKTMDVYLDGKLDDGVLMGPVTGLQKSSRGNVNLGKRSGSNQFDFAGAIGDARIYSLPLTQAAIAADMHGNGASSAQEARDNPGDEPLNPLGDEECAASPDPEEKNLPGAAATLGVLVSIAGIALFPSRGPLLSVAISVAAAVLLVTAVAPTILAPTSWVVLLLALAGAAAVGWGTRIRT